MLFFFIHYLLTVFFVINFAPPRNFVWGDRTGGTAHATPLLIGTNCLCHCFRSLIGCLATVSVLFPLLWNALPKRPWISQLWFWTSAFGHDSPVYVLPLAFAGDTSDCPWFTIACIERL